MLNETSINPNSVDPSAPPAMINFAMNITTGSYYMVVTTMYAGLGYTVSYFQYGVNYGANSQSTSSQSTGTGTNTSKLTTTTLTPFSPM